MYKSVVALILVLLLVGCKSTQRPKIITKKSTKTIETRSEDPAKVENSVAIRIIGNAMQYDGVRYKYGGTTRSGMDCSGLVFTAFKSEQISLPRISRDMAKEGNAIQLNQVQKGDLLFFKTGKKRRAVNHVGLVVDVKGKQIEFIHSTTSKGVITSKLDETYWQKAFVEARRIL